MSCGTTDSDADATGAASITTQRPSLSNRTQITVPADPYLLIMGDSNTQGHAAVEPTKNGYAYLVTSRLGWKATVDGVPGTGWTWGGGTDGGQANKFSDRISRLKESGYRPNIIIFEGGENDFRFGAEETTQAVVDTIEQARHVWPGVQVVVMGPVAPLSQGATLSGANNAIIEGAVRAKAAIVNPLKQGWFTINNSPAFSDGNGSHFNTEGHRYLADKIMGYLPEIGFTTRVR